MTPAEFALWCRCGTERNPIPCVGGCDYLCQRLAAEFGPDSGFTEAQIIAGLTTPATQDDLKR